MSIDIIKPSTIYRGAKVALASMFLAFPAAAEWIPPVCCPERDCTRDAEVSVDIVPGGYQITGVASLVAFDDPRVQPSQDGRWHVCVRTAAMPGMDVTGAYISGLQRELKCLFVPMTG